MGGDVLTQGYDTPIGEHGLRLSGGERQRLASARALLQDPPILILDEPTAHLDAANEREVLRALLVAMQDRATILITHQRAHLGIANVILTLD